MNFIISLVCHAFLIEGIRASLRPRIVGGENADIKDSPFLASLRIEGVHFCGAVIVSERHLVTAAHCIVDDKDIYPPYSLVSVHTGTSKSNENGNSHRIATITPHPGWPDMKSGLNDLAIITLVDKISFNGKQRKIKLASRDVVVGKKKATFTGWGATTVIRGQVSVQLQKLKMTLLSNEDCQLQHRVKIYEKKQLCAYHSEGHGTCFGDSGGPLVADDELIGILSWVIDGKWACGAAEVFTNIYGQRDFILSVINT